MMSIHRLKLTGAANRMQRGPRIHAGPGSLAERSAAEGVRMGRGQAAVIVTAILLVSLGVAAVVIWQAKAQGIPLFYILGPLMMVVGIVFTVLHLSVSDEYLRQHFGGEENATRIRQMWRGGWGGVVIGAAMIAAEYFLASGI